MNNDQRSSGRAAGALFMMQPVNGISRLAADTSRSEGAEGGNELHCSSLLLLPCKEMPCKEIPCKEMLCKKVPCKKFI